MSQFAVVIDLDRCTGCHACTVACAQENRLKPAVVWNRVREIGPDGRFPELHMYFLPLACQHCAEPACIKVCPTGASHKRNDGVVLIDRDKCIGCKSCQQACPYKIQYFDAEAKKMEKCTLCNHLLDCGDLPVCVKTCTTGARSFGDISDWNSRVTKLLEATSTYSFRLLPQAGTNPSARYILRRQPWLDCET
jgi:Fe-S-cluster-containing dehydrogenase component